MIIISKGPGATFQIVSSDSPPIVTSGPVEPSVVVNLVPVGTPPWSVTLHPAYTVLSTIVVFSPDVVICENDFTAEDAMACTIVGD